LKQEGFVRAYIENGGNATQAYRDNYAIKTMSEKSINEESSKLLKNPKIASRLEEYHQRTQRRHQISVDSLTADMIENRELALQTAQAGAAQTATMGLAKLHGLLIEKQAHEVSIAVGFAERLAARRAADA
jgi:phage terminase small subunit